MAVKISSTGEWEKMLAGHSVVIADFYADWCGPCKMIAPTFESLATKHSKPNRIAFAKINVDSLNDVAGRYGVRAMPTFKIFHYGTVKDTVQGANPMGLTPAVEKAVKLAGPGGAPSSSFSGTGHKLGGSSSGGPVLGRGSAGGRTLSGGRGWRFGPVAFFGMLRTFVALYLVTLFSLDPYKAAEKSQFNVNRRDQPRLRTAGSAPAPGGAGGRPAANAQKPRIQTLADL